MRMHKLTCLPCVAALAVFVSGCGNSDSTTNGGGTGGKSGADAGGGSGGSKGSGGSSNSGGSAGSGGSKGSGGATGTDGGPEAGVSPLGFKPSNVDLTGLDLSKAADVIISSANCDILTETGTWACVDAKAVHTFVELPDKTKLSVFIVKSLRIEASIVVKTVEPLPAVVIALNDMTLLGSIQVTPGTTGGAGNNLSNMKGGGLGGGPAGSQTVAGGGASYCGLGGKGAAMAGSTAGTPTAVYGTPELVPLLAGSAGGAGELKFEGSGGGALQLVAGGAFTLGVGAYVTAGGNGGAYGGNGTQQPGGGGSGGAILIEASTVSLKGAITANGGGGGQGSGDAGEDGRPDATPASGGAHAVATVVSGRGGDGSGGTVLTGGNGVVQVTSNPGAGGGGAGRIRINTTSGTVDVSAATLSPASTTTCATFGKVN